MGQVAHASLYEQMRNLVIEGDDKGLEEVYTKEFPVDFRKEGSNGRQSPTLMEIALLGHQKVKQQKEALQEKTRVKDLSALETRFVNIINFLLVKGSSFSNQRKDLVKQYFPDDIWQIIQGVKYSLSKSIVKQSIDPESPVYPDYYAEEDLSGSACPIL